jgi:outer membrane protein
MKSLSFLRLAAIAAVAFMATSAVALAADQVPPSPPPVPLVIDADGILHDAKAAQDVESQLAAQQQAYEKQLSQRENQLQQTKQDLIKQQGTMSQADFEKKRRDFDQNVAAFQHDVQIKRRSLDQAFNTAMSKVRAQLLDIVREIARERHANLVLLRSQVIVYANVYDATDDALKRLDAQLPTVKVVIPKPSELENTGDGDQLPSPDGLQ